MMLHHKKLMLPSLIVIAVSLFSGFGVQEQENKVIQLLEDRAFILQQAYYGEIDFNEAEERLYQIETQPLLKEDLQSLRTTDFCEMDIVKKLEVKELQPKMTMFDHMSFQGKLLWYMEGVSGDYMYEGDYFILLKSYSDQWKLSQFDFLEN